MSGESTGGLEIIEVFQLLGTLGGLITLVALLQKAFSTNRAKRLWGNLKRVTIHRLRFTRGWGYLGDVRYESFGRLPPDRNPITRLCAIAALSQPEYVLIKEPTKERGFGPITFTEMCVLWAREAAQIEFTCEFSEVLLQREYFMAIQLRIPGEVTLTTSWSLSSDMREGWEISAQSNRIAVSLSESSRILHALPCEGVMSVEILGFRGEWGRFVGRFDLSKSMNTPVAPWSRYLTTRDSFEAHISRDEPTDGRAIDLHLIQKGAAERGIGQPPQERIVANSAGMGRMILVADKAEEQSE